MNRTQSLSGLTLRWLLPALVICSPAPRALAAGAPVAGDPSEVSSAWLSEIQSSIVASQYEFASVRTSEWTAPNVSQDIRATISSGGLAVESRTGGAAAFTWSIALTSFGRSIVAAAPMSSTVAADAARVELARGTLTEWFVNNLRGLEHGFTVTSAPSGSGPLLLGFATGGSLRMEPDEAGTSVTLIDAAGKAWLRYGELSAFDSTGRNLPALMSVAGDGLVISVDDLGAQYPINVDPLLSASSWSQEQSVQDAGFGFSVATAGDVNGDGYSDVLVGAPNFDAGQPGEGRAFLYLGSSGGLATTPNWMIEANQAGARLGHALGTAGDVNGDGYSDVIVGAPAAEGASGSAETDEGRVFVYHGLGPGTEQRLPSTASWRAEVNEANAHFGESVSTLGSVNGDSYADIIVGASLHDNGGATGADEGAAFVWFGSSTGLGSNGDQNNRDVLLDANQSKSRFGSAVAWAGDVNADGTSDAIVGAPAWDGPDEDEGRAFVFLGADTSPLGASPIVLESNQKQAAFGSSVARAGDVDGNGYGDLIVGAPWYENGQLREGRAYVWLGCAPGASGCGSNGFLTTPWTAEGNQRAALFGAVVCTAGDVNGDGYADVAVGSRLYDFDAVGFYEGRVSVFHGSYDGLPATPSWYANSSRTTTETINWGSAVAPAGDVNGDGYGDLIVGAWRWDQSSGAPLDVGAAFVFHGSLDTLSPSPAWDSSEATGSGYGLAVAFVGDVNGDKYGDALVGAPDYDGGDTDEGKVFFYLGSLGGLSTTANWTAEGNQTGARLGYNVRRAGDVNADGYPDVIIGAPYYDNGHTDEGMAFVYYGLGPGTGPRLGATPDWTAESDQAGALLGYSVSTAGNVDADQGNDIIVGAPYYDNSLTDEGIALVWHGGPSGLGANGTPANADALLDENKASALLGFSVASAGDVQRDGWGDVIVGAPKYTNVQSEEGAAFVYHGTSTGITTTNRWTAESDQANAHFGSSVATAGLVNSDFFSDVVVGAPDYDGTLTDEGAAFVYHGTDTTSTGLPTTANWTAFGGLTSARFGHAVAAAGDLSGDRFSDVVVGAPGYSNEQAGEGRLFAFKGGTSGLATAAFWTFEPDLAGAGVGTSISSGGDTNGDARGDVLASGPGNASVANHAYVFANIISPCPPCIIKPKLLSQARATTGQKPIPSSTASNPPNDPPSPGYAFRLGVRGFSAGGRARVRLEYDVRAGTSTFYVEESIRTDEFDTGAPGANGSYKDFNESITLPTSGPKKWRLRILTNDPYFPRSPWMSPVENALDETDFQVLP